MNILIYGLSGSGKSTLAIKLSQQMNLPIINGNSVRETHHDWDFSIEGRKKQAVRMHELSNKHDISIVDFICPFEEYQNLFDIKILMSTITKSQYPDTDALFEYGQPDIVISTLDYNLDDIVYDIQALFN